MMINKIENMKQNTQNKQNTPDIMRQLLNLLRQ